MTENKKVVPIEERDSKVLAAAVVAFRVLGIGREQSIEAMAELVRRKNEGDEFDFKTFIEEQVKEMPKPTIGEDHLKNIMELMKNAKSGTF